MNTGKYSLLEILEFQNLEQLIVPEIQRDYVWQTEDVKDLLESIKDGFSNNEKPYLGFIYAFTDKDYLYKYFLIDGQQRLTTVYLLLLACCQKLNKKLPPYLIKREKLKLDYKVRQATHDFLTDFVQHCKNNPNTPDFDIKAQSWIHNHYENDRTIQNIIKNYNSIVKWLECFDKDQTSQFLKFIEDDIELSYFNIENGREGEDLYIYMNSRGRPLEANETLKAKFLAKESEEDRIYWGRKWEEWQDFFWKHRGSSPDADAGFDEFLRRIQIINMCESDITHIDISNFITGRSVQKLDINLLPKTLKEIDDFFRATKWLAESSKIQDFFLNYRIQDFFTTTPDIEKKQTYYLRTLPILTLLVKTGIEDEDMILRFIRFFYNVARKSKIGKDVANHLPSSIKLILEYGKSKQDIYDVCDLIRYRNRRSVLIDDEEVLKFAIYRAQANEEGRRQKETFFWQAEDHPIFNGEINFLLNKYHNRESRQFDFQKFAKTWRAFKILFPKDNRNSLFISRTLLYYGNTWFRETPYYYENYNCQNWDLLVRQDSGKYLLELLEDMHGKPIEYLDSLIKNKIKGFFIEKEYSSIESLKLVDDLFGQIKILTAIDYFSEKKLWRYGYIAFDSRFSYGDKPFFYNNRVLYNISRYVNDGLQGRIINTLKSILDDDEKLKISLNFIWSFNYTE